MVVVAEFIPDIVFIPGIGPIPGIPDIAPLELTGAGLGFAFIYTYIGDFSRVAQRKSRDFSEANCAYECLNSFQIIHARKMYEEIAWTPKLFSRKTL
jgi:hypothetical protein